MSGPASESSGAPRAFIVDDDPDFLDLIVIALKKLGIAAEGFATPEEFLQRLKSESPTICFIDLNIGRPGVGFSLIRAIRSVRGEELTLFVVSSTSDGATVAHALDIGADDFISKPIRPELLAGKLKRRISSESLRRQLTVRPGAIAATQTDLKLRFSVRVLEVDELGITLQTTSFLKKGTEIELDGGFAAEIGAVRAKVERTLLDESGETHTAYAEFDPKDEELGGRIRKWLTSKLG